LSFLGWGGAPQLPPSDSPPDPRYTRAMASIGTTVTTSTTPGNRGRVVAV